MIDSHCGLRGYLSGIASIRSSVIHMLVPIGSTAYGDLIGQIELLPIDFRVVEILLLRVPRGKDATHSALELCPASHR